MYRGDIYYINKFESVGSEQFSGRPAIIVSNNKNNATSEVVEIVYLTTQPKSDLPTHVTIRSLDKTSIAICEQITSISKQRIGDYIGRCTVDEMSMLDLALKISLGISDNAEIGPIERERDLWKAMYENIVDKIVGK